MLTTVPSPTPTTSAAPARHRDVVVWAVSGPGTGYAVTDQLRAAGLSVGSWMQPPGASADRVLRQLTRDLERGALPATWASAPVVVTLWASRRQAAVAAGALRQVHAHAVCHIDLTPAGAPQSLPDDAWTLRAPTRPDWGADRVYLTDHGHARLRAAAETTATTAPTLTSATVERVLEALTALPVLRSGLLMSSNT